MRRKFLYFIFCILTTVQFSSGKGSANAHNLKAKFLKKYQQEREEFLIQKIKNYFLSLKHVKLTFEQIYQNGKVSNGEMILRKPNTLKIQYIQPNQDRFTLNDRMLLEYYDSELGETTELPLPRVLDIILFNDFSHIQIEHAFQQGNEITLQVKHEDTIVTFIMTANPIKLLRWNILQNNQLVTTHIIKISHIK